MTGLTRCPDVVIRSGALSSFCCSFFRSASEKTNNRCNGKYHAAEHPEPVEGQAKRRLKARPRKSCQLRGGAGHGRDRRCGDEKGESRRPITAPIPAKRLLADARLVLMAQVTTTESLSFPRALAYSRLGGRGSPNGLADFGVRDVVVAALQEAALLDAKAPRALYFFGLRSRSSKDDWPAIPAPAG